MRIVKYFLWFFLVLIVSIVAIIGLNYFKIGSRTSILPQDISVIAGSPITVLNWNLGYAGLGKESDFVMDGGQNLFPPSRAIVDKNIKGIVDLIANTKADLYQFQEISKPDMLTLGADVLAAVDHVLLGKDRVFSYDFETWFVPRRWALKHGLASYAGIKTEAARIYPLPNETERLGGVVKRQYQMIERRLTDKQGQDWVFFDVHLAAFDEGGKARQSQLRALLDYAESLYQDGYHVVVGGDFNLQLTATEFPFTTDKKYLFWLEVFPVKALQPGWALAFDPTRPTVRSNERPYQPNENYSTIIDGFLHSPNVTVANVRTIETGFEYTDHQPILASFKAKSDKTLKETQN